MTRSGKLCSWLYAASAAFPFHCHMRLHDHQTATMQILSEQDAGFLLVQKVLQSA